MFNNWFTIGPITIHGYGVMIAVGILSAIWFAQRQARKHNMDADSIDLLAITAVVVGYIFSKLTYVLTVWDAFLANPMAVLGSSGWVVYGGIIGGILGHGSIARFARWTLLPISISACHRWLSHRGLAVSAVSLPGAAMDFRQMEHLGSHSRKVHFVQFMSLSFRHS